MTLGKFSLVTLSAFLGLLAVAGTSSFAVAETYTLPDETATLKKSSDPGYQKAADTCSICHSVDYISTQPPGKGKDFWTAEVKKMIGVYGAPVQEGDRAAIIEYLTTNY